MRGSAGRRLVDAVPASDTVSRLGGDEFFIVLNGVVDADEVALIVDEQLVPHLRQVHNIVGTDLHVICSIGIALYPADAQDIDTLMRHADAWLASRRCCAGTRPNLGRYRRCSSSPLPRRRD